MITILNDGVPNGSFVIVDGTQNLQYTEENAGGTNLDLSIGSIGNGLYYLDGYIAEFIVISGVVSESGRQKVEGYLAHKWGLQGTLSNDHPYKLTGPNPMIQITMVLTIT